MCGVGCAWCRTCHIREVNVTVCNGLYGERDKAKALIKIVKISCKYDLCVKVNFGLIKLNLKTDSLSKRFASLYY